MKKIIFTILCALQMPMLIATELTDAEKEALGQRALKEMVQKIWTEAMVAKQAYQEGMFREEYLSNLSSSAPRIDFIVHADISPELEAGEPEATIYVSTDGQNSWNSTTDVSPMNAEGFETTWEGQITTDGSPNVAWYIAGEVSSEALGFDYGRLIVTGTPENTNGAWPPGDNLYGLLATDEIGDANSAQDIFDVKGTYNSERFYMSMGINGGCCDEGGLFGPWYLYGVAIVNPESESDVAYAIGYGDGGFGQLSPGLLKITGDLATGEIGAFDYITTNIDYSTTGNHMQATALMSYLTSDPDWGDWPNSVNGFIALGVTVEASLDGLDVAASIMDQSTPGLMILATQFQEGNTDPVVTNPAYDSATMELSVLYTDAEGNLPWWRNAQVCETPENGGLCYISIPLIPEDHNYIEGVTFKTTIADTVASLIEQGTINTDTEYQGKFWFADDVPGAPQQYVTISFGQGGGCALPGDANGDELLNILDVVLTVNLILANEYDDCADLNGDGALNILDVVSLVNIILTSP